MTHVRGLQETRGMNGLRVVPRKAEPGKITTKLARLDHQRGLLERQLAVWTEKQQVTKHRLSLVEKQLTEAGRLVRQLGAVRRTGKGRKQMHTIAAAKGPDGAAVSPPHKEMNLEY
jgi:hypothetical protein